MKLWDRACKIIPGGNQLVSKRPNRYCPGKWPTHYTYAYGNTITDAETGKQYKDFSTMGIGSCVLGYGNSAVDSAVLNAIAKGNMSSLNSIEELMLTEKLLELNPRMDMVRFARTGGEACKVAVEICNAYNEGYGGWYIHHGYSGWILGTPEETYGDSFNNIINLNDLSDGGWSTPPDCVIMEPVRNHPAESLQLMKDARKWCTENNVPLIFDEITSGFRANIGGYHITKGIYPDMVVYGKAMGNGYPISAVMGTREIMEAAEKTFISSTFWSERTGYAAALETINQMEKLKVPEHLISIGKQVQNGWKDCAEIAGVDLDVHGIYPLSGFKFRENHRERSTYFTQEMLKYGYLASNQFYSALPHTKEETEKYLGLVGKIFEEIGNSEEQPIGLDGPLADEGWKRCN